MAKGGLIGHMVSLLRPNHYLKNLFVFLPLFFAGRFREAELLIEAALAFAAFCLVASSVYVFNDLRDVNEDRLHPEKQNRPIAAGHISISRAVILDILLTLVALVVAGLLSWTLLGIILGYKVLNIAYTLGLKKIAVIDVVIISLGFVLRLFAGSEVTGVVLTEWIIILTFLLSLMLALGKRRNDVLVFENEGKLLRTSVKDYNLRFLDYSMMVIASVILVAYIMYTLAPETVQRVGTDKLYITAVWVLLGILRYLQQLFVLKNTDNPVRLLLRDHLMKLILLAWMITFLYFIYFD